MSFLSLTTPGKASNIHSAHGQSQPEWPPWKRHSSMQEGVTQALALTPNLSTSTLHLRRHKAKRSCGKAAGRRHTPGSS